jgi:hypothetical protein
MTRTLIGIAVVAMTSAVTCARTADVPPAAPARAAPEPTGDAGANALGATMHIHFALVTEIHRALIVGDLSAARDRARTLSRMEATAELGQWQDRVQFLREQAARLAEAMTAHEARRLSTELATFCADCHIVSAEPSRFRLPPKPASDGSLRAAMARHEWAAESMWLGVLAPSTERWRDGLDAIELLPADAAALAGHERSRDFERLGRRLAALASRSRELPGQGDRAIRLAEITQVCAACHALTRR